MVKTYFGQEPLKSQTTVRGCGGMSLVFIDHFHSVAGPTEVRGQTDQLVLQGPGFFVILHLLRTGLTHVNLGHAIPVSSLYFTRSPKRMRERSQFSLSISRGGRVIWSQSRISCSHASPPFVEATTGVAGQLTGLALGGSSDGPEREGP